MMLGGCHILQTPTPLKIGSSHDTFLYWAVVRFFFTLQSIYICCRQFTKIHSLIHMYNKKFMVHGFSWLYIELNRYTTQS